MTDEVEGVRDVALSVPRVVGAQGVTAQLFPEMNEAEHAALERSARLLKDTSSALRL
jgi:L-lactate dehydrogenase